VLLSGTPICKVLIVGCFKIGEIFFQVIIHKEWNHTWGSNIHVVEPVAANMEVDNFELRHPRCGGSITKNFFFVYFTYRRTQLYFT